MKIKSIYFNAIFSILTIALYNGIYFKKVFEITNNGLFTILLFISLCLLLNVACSLLFIKRTTKFLAILLTLINGAILYFMYAYNIAIDSNMVLNALETDRAEAFDLFSLRSLFYFFIWGIVPATIIAFTKIEYKTFLKELLSRSLIVFLCLSFITTFLFSGYKTTAQFLRNNRSARYYLIPNNYIGAMISIYKIKSKSNRELIKIGEDAKFVAYNNKPNLFVFMVGETARAANFSLYGYHRDTNEPLKKHKKDLLVFKDFDACATSTAVALPCIFSQYGRHDFKPDSQNYTENVLDILQKGGYKLLWKENNSSCKSNCTRIETIDFQKQAPRFDEILLGDFDKTANGKNAFIVLHTQGSHGPKYYLRTPKEYQKYQPTCQTESLDKCSQEEIVNIYDNSIYYTSDVLSKTIDELKSLQNKYNVVFIYVSDHGESLGENNVYLHAAPYAIAPSFQIKIPFIIWLDDKTAKELNINKKCLQTRAEQLHSHDNIYHSILGLSGISTKDYNPNLDIFAECKK